MPDLFYAHGWLNPKATGPNFLQVDEVYKIFWTADQKMCFGGALTDKEFADCRRVFQERLQRAR